MSDVNGGRIFRDRRIQDRYLDCRPRDRDMYVYMYVYMYMCTCMRIAHATAVYTQLIY